MTPAEPYSPHPLHDWLPGVAAQGAFALIMDSTGDQQEALYDLDYYTSSARDTYQRMNRCVAGKCDGMHPGRCPEDEA